MSRKRGDKTSEGEKSEKVEREGETGNKNKQAAERERGTY